MRKILRTGFALSGWLLLAIFLISGHFYNKMTNDQRAIFSPIGWGQHMNLFNGAVVCSLSDEDLIERKAFLKEAIFSQIQRKEASENAHIYYFDDDPQLLSYIFEFVEKEKACCPFFKFDIAVLPMNKGIAVQISGSKAAIEFLKEFEAEKS